jgi:hypothetical protein
MSWPTHLIAAESPTCAQVAPVCHPIGVFHPMCAPRDACGATWHHRAPSAFQIRQVVRAPYRIRNVAAFNRDSFACEQLARRRALALAADPQRLPAERAYTELPQALARSVVRWCAADLPAPTAARLGAPKGATRRMPPDQGLPCHAPVKARDAGRPSMPSTGSTFPFGKGDRLG